MEYVLFPVIDPEATGRNIQRLRQQRGLTVRDLQAYFGFTEPQAVYKWQSGRSLPTVDNLLALSALLGVPMDQILVVKSNIRIAKQQAKPAASCFYQELPRKTSFLKQPACTVPSARVYTPFPWRRLFLISPSYQEPSS